MIKRFWRIKTQGGPNYGREMRSCFRPSLGAEWPGKAKDGLSGEMRLESGETDQSRVGSYSKVTEDRIILKI